MRIGIIDSGIDNSHKRLKGCSVTGVSIKQNGNHNYKISNDFHDDLGHGTGIASIIYKSFPKCQLIAVKIFHERLTTTEQLLYEAIKWCIENKINIINLSLGVQTNNPKTELYEICKFAYDKNIVIIAAAHNILVTECYPAYFSEVFGVISGSVDNRYEFGFIDKSPIEFIANGKIQRVAHTNGSFVLADGSSYACAYFTGIVASILYQKRKIIGIKRLRDYLVAKANKNIQPIQFKTRTIGVPLVLRYDLNEKGKLLFQKNKLNWLGKIALFPISEKEIKHLLEFPQLVKYNIAKYIDYPRSLGKRKYTSFKNTFEVYDKKLSNTDFGCIDSFVFGYFHEHLFQANVRFGEDLLARAVEYNKNMYIFDKRLKNSIDNLTVNSKYSGNVYLPSVDNKMFRDILLFRHLPAITKPVLAVIGTGSKQGKFTTQLQVKKILEKEGYNISHISTEPHGELFGAVFSYPYGFNRTVNIDIGKWALFLRSLTKAIEKYCDPHLILTGTQSWIIPSVYNIEPNGGEFESLGFLYGINPDAVICAISPNDSIKLIERTISTVQAYSKSRVLFFVITPWLKEFIKDKQGRFVSNYRYLSKDELNEKIEIYQNQLDAPVIDVVNKKNELFILDSIQKFFS